MPKQKPIRKELEDGDIEYRLPNGKKHREDGPAVEFTDGTKIWYLEDQRHREDGPAVECSDGSTSWWKHGELHRLDGPAIEYPDGTKFWYEHGKFIRKEVPEDKKNVWFKLDERVPDYNKLVVIHDGRYVRGSCEILPAGSPGLSSDRDTWIWWNGHPDLAEFTELPEGVVKYWMDPSLPEEE